MQQAELLSSLALKVDAENVDQSLENAWKVRLGGFRTSVFEHFMDFFKNKLQLMSSKAKTKLQIIRSLTSTELNQVLHCQAYQRENHRSYLTYLMLALKILKQILSSAG